MGRNPKRALPCPNPLFEKLLKDWKDEATAKGSKLQYAYSKVLYDQFTSSDIVSEKRCFCTDHPDKLSANQSINLDSTIKDKKNSSKTLQIHR